MLPTSKNGDVPSPKTNIPQNGNAVNSENEKIEASGENKNVNWHGLGVDGLEKAVAALDNPLRAFKQENGKYGFVVQIDGESKPMYAVIEIDTKGNYRGTIEKANVLVTAFGTDLNYIENQAAKGTELKIKKEPDSRGIDPSNRRYDIGESNSETGDVPSPKTNIPQNGNAVNSKNEKIEASAESFAEGKQAYAYFEAHEQDKNSNPTLKDKLKEMIESIGGEHSVIVDGTEFNGKTYEVRVNKNVAKKLAGDKGKSAEKFAVLRDIDNIIKNAKFVGSGDYVQHGARSKKATRYDYLETKATIDGKPYVVAFDVEVIPGANNYRTHKVLNEINLTSVQSVEVDPNSTAQGKKSGLQGDVPSPKTNIPQNGNAVNSKNEKIEASAESCAG